MGSGPGGGLGGPNGGPPSALDVSFKSVGGYSTSNQYSTMPMLKQDKLDGTNIYQTTTLSTFGRGGGGGGGGVQARGKLLHDIGGSISLESKRKSDNW